MAWTSIIEPPIISDMCVPSFRAPSGISRQADRPSPFFPSSLFPLSPSSPCTGPSLPASSHPPTVRSSAPTLSKTPHQSVTLLSVSRTGPPDQHDLHARPSHAAARPRVALRPRHLLRHLQRLLPGLLRVALPGHAIPDTRRQLRRRRRPRPSRRGPDAAQGPGWRKRRHGGHVRKPGRDEGKILFGQATGSGAEVVSAWLL